jgi:GH15 family glucan-1,4-alpha-glucosidase
MRWIRDSRYKPISAYGVIGDTRTAALVGQDGSIDWCCFPRFDSPSVFAALLDVDAGGSCSVRPALAYTSAQRYFPLTNILVTSFHLREGSGAMEVLDFMPTPPGDEATLVAPHEIHRRIRGVRGALRVQIEFSPRFDYARVVPSLEPSTCGVVARANDDTLSLGASEALEWEVDANAGVVRASFDLAQGEDVWLVLRWCADEAEPANGHRSQLELNRTAQFWNEWAGSLQYEGMYRAEVERSALALKALFYEPTGAVVAAVTTSLPEDIGGVRNWDYRYCWLRDAAFTLSAFNIVGHIDEARRFVQYLQWVAGKTTHEPLQIMYGVGGEVELAEVELPHLSGYRDSKPIRIGNGAHSQLQLDIYGELLAAVFLWHERAIVDDEFWQLLVEIVDWVAENWRRPDSSIWEVRAEPRHYVFSKVMCWVALDRAVRMAHDLGKPPTFERWKCERDAIHAEVLERGWNEQKRSFVQSYDSDALDAANLLIPFYGFLPGSDERMLGTISATQRELTREGMLYRYTSADGLPGQEGVFSICPFWLADALILSGDIEGGERVFRRMLRLANPLGLYSEQIEPRTGDFLGNFPQAFTHIALINTAYLLEQAYREREPGATRQAEGTQIEEALDSG